MQFDVNVGSGSVLIDEHIQIMTRQLPRGYRACWIMRITFNRKAIF